MGAGRVVTPEAARPPARPVTRGAAAGYAAGDLGISIAYFAVGFFFLFYLTDLVGLSPAVAGTVVLIGKLWDGVNDPIIGVLVDRTRSRHGRKRAYLLYGAVPFALSFIALWWLPAGSAPTRPGGSAPSWPTSGATRPTTPRCSRRPGRCGSPTFR